jgi:hypothetical protein
MQPYFDPIRKTTSKKKMEDNLKKKIKNWKMTSKKKMEDNLKFFFDPTRKMTSKENGRRPQKQKN